MTDARPRYNTTYDLTNCDAEPLRFIRSCQDQATMIVLYADTLRIKAFSENAPKRYGKWTEDLLGADAGAVLGEDALAAIKKIGPTTDLTHINPVELLTVTEGEGQYSRENLIIHREGNLLILEIEPRDKVFASTDFLMRIDKAMARVQKSMELKMEVFQAAVREVRALSGFDRVYIYQFDKDYNGHVIAEEKIDDLHSYLNLRYPHTDIPKQARELYMSQQVRHVCSTRVDSDNLLISDDEAPINLQKTANRGVSPIHLEYMRNMGTGASLSIAITVSGKLWGLIACHHRHDRVIDFRLRKLLGFFGRILSGHLALSQSADYQNNLLSTSLLRAKLVERMNDANDLLEPLTADSDKLLELIDATGVALLLDGQVVRFGECPEEAEIEGLISLVADQPESIYSTHTLHKDYPASKQFKSTPAGLVSIRISRSPGEYIMWFRPEIVTTLDWGGKPEHRKTIEGGKVRLHPSLSFTKYTETKHGEAKPWDQYQLDNALALRNDIKEIILVKYQQMRQINAQLMNAYEELESFSYTVSHDLRAPLRSIRGFTEILVEDYGDQLDEYGQSALKVIVTNVAKMNDFIDGILEFSRLGQNVLRQEPVDLEELIEQVWNSMPDTAAVALTVTSEVDTIFGDHTLLHRLFLNLLSNSVKYRTKEGSPWLKVNAVRRGGDAVIEVADNGIGFDMQYAAQIFAVFNRLVSEEEYEGTGVGLAIASRIVERHRGRISVESELGVGTTFTIRLPIDAPADLGE